MSSFMTIQPMIILNENHTVPSFIFLTQVWKIYLQFRPIKSPPTVEQVATSHFYKVASKSIVFLSNLNKQKQRKDFHESKHVKNEIFYFLFNY